jgi:hypothetical protein
MWNYNFSLPPNPDGHADMEHYVHPYVVMVADLGDGKAVLSTSVLNFPDKPIRPGVPPPQDRPEFKFKGWFFADYVPQLNAVIVKSYGSKVLDKRGTRTDLFYLLSMQREPLIRFGESWWKVTSHNALHPSMPMLLTNERVPDDDALRDTYIDTYALDKMPQKQQFVLYDLLSGKEIDRLDRHKTSVVEDRSLYMSWQCFSPDGQHFTYRQDGTMLTLYKVTINHKEN